MPDYKEQMVSKYPFFIVAMFISTLSYGTALILIKFYKICVDFNVISRTSFYEVTLMGSSVIELTRCSSKYWHWTGSGTFYDNTNGTHKKGHRT